MGTLVSNCETDILSKSAINKLQIQILTLTKNLILNTKLTLRPQETLILTLKEEKRKDVCQFDRWKQVWRKVTRISDRLRHGPSKAREVINKRSRTKMDFSASGKRGFYPSKANYQPNIDAGLLAHVREEVLRREEEQKREQEKEEERREEDRKRGRLVTQIQSIVLKTLPNDSQEKITYNVMNSLALSLMDGTVFEIVRGLEDIQQLSERNLLNKRMKLINSQKAERMQQNKLHKAAIESCSNKPHNLPLVTKKNAQEKQNLESKLEQELMQTDQKLVLELDRVVADQQTTMERAGVPLFHITNDSNEIQLQMYILDIVTKLSSS